MLVQIENKKCNKVKGKGVSVQLSDKGIVVDTNIPINKYKVKVEVEGKEIEEWLSVSKMSSITSTAVWVEVVSLETHLFTHMYKQCSSLETVNSPAWK